MKAKTALKAGGGERKNNCGCGGGVNQNGLVNVNDVNILSGIGIFGVGVAF